MKKLFLFSLCCFLFFIANAQVVSLNTAEIAKLKVLVSTNADAKNQWRGLLKRADDALLAKPNPADTILSEGILQGDPRKTKTRKSLADMPKMYALAIAYKINGEQKYLDKASEFLLAWAIHNQPQGNPINDTNLDQIIFTYDLLKTNLKPDVVTAVKLWLNEVVKQEMKTLNKALAKRDSTKAYNNWNSHRIKTITQVVSALDARELINAAIQLYLVQISKNLRSDGSSFDFHERDALHYHVYDVDPLLVAATILTRDSNVKGDFYTYTSKGGSSLKKSVEWLFPYFTGAIIHGEFVNSKVAFDKKRAQNGEKGYIAGTPFNPSEARTSIALAGYFDPKMISIYQQQAKTSSKYPTWQFVLNEVKR